MSLGAACLAQAKHLCRTSMLLCCILGGAHFAKLKPKMRHPRIRRLRPKSHLGAFGLGAVARGPCENGTDKHGQTMVTSKSRPLPWGPYPQTPLGNRVTDKVTAKSTPVRFALKLCHEGLLQTPCLAGL